METWVHGASSLQTYTAGFVFLFLLRSSSNIRFSHSIDTRYCTFSASAEITLSLNNNSMRSSHRVTVPCWFCNHILLRYLPRTPWYNSFHLLLLRVRGGIYGFWTDWYCLRACSSPFGPLLLSFLQWRVFWGLYLPFCTVLRLRFYLIWGSWDFLV